MECPNCAMEFRLRADYAQHLQACRPAEYTLSPYAWRGRIRRDAAPERTTAPREREALTR
ncbi:MAG: hypothetical protein HYX50_03995 [Chloroflexi bacterium]|nr:hypothetical protein [Chloroflexota bacterium]